MMKRLVWRFRQWHVEVRWTLFFSLCLVLANLLAGLVYFYPTVRRLDSVEASLADFGSAAYARQGLLLGSPQSPEEKLAAFYAFFPGTDGVLGVLENVFEAAKRENMVLPQGEYHFLPETQGKLIRYDLVLPVKGTYPGLRRFMAQSLRENPALALQEVHFSRQAVSDIGVDAQLRFVLYTREAAR